MSSISVAIRARAFLRHKIMVALGSVLVLLYVSPAIALQSTKLDDVIKSNGIGNIDLFTAFNAQRTLDGATLEQFRQDNNGELVFAVDVNEAADGSEKASSQGVAVQSAELIVVIGGVEYRYTQFTTRTHSMLAVKGSTQRSLYSTLIGDAGSSRVTPNSASDIYGSSFDATLNFTISQDISQASSAILNILFLDTNVSLGDPEAFYDFSNGFEDIAIVTAEDASYLNQLAPGIEEAPLVLPEDTVATTGGGTIYYPSQTGYYIASYEDYYPYRGDYDFNDLVVGYRVAAGFDSDGNIQSVSGEGYLVARGAGYNHDWHLRIAMPAFASGSTEIKLFMPDESNVAGGYPLTESFSGDLDMILFPDTRRLWIDTSYEGVNTLEEQALVRGHRFQFAATLDNPVALADFDMAPFDPYLYVQDTRFEIHLQDKSPSLDYSRNVETGNTSFIDSYNYPFAQVFPDTWQVPIERTDLGDAYPEFVEFVLSGNSVNTQWYNAPKAARVKAITPSHWKW